MTTPEQMIRAVDTVGLLMAADSIGSHVASSQGGVFYLLLNPPTPPTPPDGRRRPSPPQFKSRFIRTTLDVNIRKAWYFVLIYKLSLLFGSYSSGTLLAVRHHLG